MLKSLKSRISMIYLCLVMMIAIVGIASVINLYKLSGSINDLMTANYKSIYAASNMLEANRNRDLAILNYLTMDRQKGLNSFLENNTFFTHWYDIEKNNITEPGESTHVENIDTLYSSYMKSFLELQEIKNNQDSAIALQYNDSNILAASEKLKQELKALSSLNENAMFNGKDNANQNSKRAMYIILTLASAMILSGFLVSRFFTGRFLMPLYYLRETMKSVKKGDLSKQAKIISDDEVGLLASEFNSMTRRLFEYERSALGSLMAEKNRFLAVVKNLSDPLVVMDEHFKVLIINRACEQIFDTEEDKSLGKHFLEVIRNSEVFDYIAEVFSSGEEHKERIIPINSGSVEYYFNIVVTVVKNAENSLTGLIVTFQNVTELKQLDKIKTDFIATISHNFKTPLTSIIMGTDLLLGDGLGALNDEQKSIAKVLKEDGERLSSLINDFLELSKLESGKAILRLEPCSISAIIENSCKQFYQLAENKDVTLDFEAAEKLPKVSADYEKIIWVLDNLVSNAIKFTNAGDQITISASVREGLMRVSVKDTGAGISDEIKERIFDRPFESIGDMTNGRGTGLGLNISKQIVQAHGGEIWCESVLDAGSTFTFSLKLA